MNILVINCGSSSLKYQLFSMQTEEVLASGLVERIGTYGTILKYQCKSKEKITREIPEGDHKSAITEVLNILTSDEYGAIKSLSEIQAVGHRVVHGAETFKHSSIITDDVIKAIEDAALLAPLHNPPNLTGIRVCSELLPDVPQVAVFDTSFHQTMPKSSYLYALPYSYYEKYRIRRYGFHGTSHKFVATRAASLLGKKLEDTNLITCHLGNGASVTAIQNGKSIDTSMGFTPLEGLVMGTRSGDIDPAIIEYIMDQTGLSISAVIQLLNKESGMLGLSGVGSDFRDIESASKEGNKKATLALEIFHNRVKKYIGGYIALLGSIDAIVFTAGLGENSAYDRYEITKGLENLGIIIDEKRNDTRGKEVKISSDNSKISIFVIPTNEELEIAKDTLSLISK